MKRPSERERKAREFKEYKQWKAEDFRHFILATVGLICSRRRFLPDAHLYKVLVYLANLVYLMYNPRVNNTLIEEMKKNMIRFVDEYHARIGLPGCTWKFHIFQHFIELILIHGSALFWDGFFREKIVGELKEYFTGTRNEDEQIVINYLLSHHAKRYYDACAASPRMKRFFDSQLSEYSGKSLTQNVHFKWECDEGISASEKAIVRNLSGSDDEGKRVKRLSRLIHGGTVISSKAFPHRGMVDDTWLYLDEERFGQVEEILVVDGDERERFVVRLMKYRKVSIMDVHDTHGEELLFPINQFPAETVGQVEYVLVEQSTRVQKMSVGAYEYDVLADDDSTRVVKTPFFCVWPEYV